MSPTSSWNAGSSGFARIRAYKLCRDDDELEDERQCSQEHRMIAMPSVVEYAVFLTANNESTASHKS